MRRPPKDRRASLRPASAVHASRPPPPSWFENPLIRNQVTAYPKTSLDIALYKYIRIYLYSDDSTLKQSEKNSLKSSRRKSPPPFPPCGHKIPASPLYSHALMHLYTYALTLFVSSCLGGKPLTTTLRRASGIEYQESRIEYRVRDFT